MKSARNLGPASLSDAELLSVILRCGARGRNSLSLPAIF